MHNAGNSPSSAFTRYRAARPSLPYGVHIAPLQQTQRSESLRTLSGGLAHNFNNLLAGILGNADLALMDLASLDGELQPLVADALCEIRKAAVRGAELTSFMLAYAGEGGMAFGSLSLADLVEQTAPQLIATLPCCTHVAYLLDHDVPPLEADATDLRQVLSNLVGNAAEAFGTAGGTVHVCVCSNDMNHGELLDPEGVPLAAGHYIVLEVIDSGVGMDERTLARVFEPFFTTKFLGRGLGLPAVQGIVRAHRGAITIQSAVGQGTTVRVFLPCSSTHPLPRGSS
ncbi:MAG: ATP-binding protein [Myxococcales bacterium]